MFYQLPSPASRWENRYNKALDSNGGASCAIDFSIHFRGRANAGADSQNDRFSVVAGLPTEPDA